MSKRGKGSVPKTASGQRPKPGKSRNKRPGNGKPRTATKDTPLLLSKKEVRSDVALVQEAVKGRWPVPDTKRHVIIRRLLGVVRKTSVTVITKQGEVVDAEAPADTNAVLAARVLVQMEAQNQKDDFRGEPSILVKNEQHIHVNNGNGESERPVDPEAEQRRLRLSKLAESLRARSLVIDGVAIEPGAAGGLDRNQPLATPVSARTGN